VVRTPAGPRALVGAVSGRQLEGCRRAIRWVLQGYFGAVAQAGRLLLGHRSVIGRLQARHWQPYRVDHALVDCCVMKPLSGL